MEYMENVFQCSSTFLLLLTHVFVCVCFSLALVYQISIVENSTTDCDLVGQKTKKFCLKSYKLGYPF